MHDVLTGLVKDIVRMLKKHENFFEARNDEKRKIVEDELHVSSFLKQYILSVTEEDFMNHMKSMNAYIHGDTTESTPLFEALSQFLVQEFSGIVDREEDIPYKGSFGEALQEYVSFNSTQEISEAVYNLLSVVQETPYVVIQTPCALAPKDKEEIRESLLKKHTLCFPLFRINPELLGGMRIFVDGETHDMSWKARLSSIFQNIYSVV